MRDTLTILTCAPSLRAAKVFWRKRDGAWGSQGYSRMKHFEGRERAFEGIDELYAQLLELSRRPRSLVVRGRIMAGVDRAEMVRQLNVTLSETDHHWFSLDFDGAPAEPGFSYQDSSTWTATVRARLGEIGEHLGVDLHEADFIVQVSASAGLDEPASGEPPRFNAHVWLLSERKVCSSSLREVFKRVNEKAWAAVGAETADERKESALVDLVFFNAVQVHYTADPIFRGDAEDPVTGPRVLLVRGAQRAVRIPGACNLATWRARERAERERQQRLQREYEAQRAAALQAGDARIESTESRARRYLQIACEKIRAAGSGRHTTIVKQGRWIGGLLAGGSGLTRGEAVAELEAAARHALAGERRRLRDIPRIVADALDLGAKSPIHVKDAARLAMRAPKKPTRPEVRPSTCDHAEDVADCAVDAATVAGDDLVNVDAATTSAAADVDAAAASDDTEPEHAPVSLDEGRVQLREGVRRALTEGGVWSFRAPPGAGKSHAVREELLDVIKTNHWTARLVVPTHDLIAETLTAYRLESARRGLGLSVEPAPARGPKTCHIWDHYQLASKLGPQYGKRICEGCYCHPSNREGRMDGCGFFEALERAEGAEVTVCTHALEAATALERAECSGDTDVSVDVIALDETPMGCVVHQHTLTGAHLTEMTAHRVLEAVAPPIRDGELLSWHDRLHRLRALSIQEGRRIHSDEIQARVPAEVFELAVGDYLEETWKRANLAGRMGGHDAFKDVIDAAVPGAVLAALHRVLQNNWQGAVIQDGAIHIAWGHAFPNNAERVFIALDATTTPDLSRALHGEEVQFCDVAVERSEHFRCEWVPMDSSKLAHLGGASELRRDQAARYFAAARLADVDGTGEGVLHVTLKERTVPGAWTGDVLRFLHPEASVIYHNSPASRGSNLYRDYHTVRVESWYVPRAAVEQTAEVLALIAGDNPHEEQTAARWREEARWQLEGAPVAQVVARIRPLDATAEHPKRVLFVDSISPAGRYGLTPDITHNVEMLRWYLAGDESWTAADVVIEDHVEACGGVWLPTVDDRRLHPTPWERSWRESQLCGARLFYEVSRGLAEEPHATSGVTSEKPPRPGRSSPCTRVIGWVERNCGGDWRTLPGALAQVTDRDDLDLEVTYVQTDRGGAPRPILYQGVLDLSQLERWLAYEGATRYQLDGETFWRVLPVLEGRIDHALLWCEAPNPNTQTLTSVWIALGARLDQAPASVRRTFDRLRLEGEDLWDTLRRYWHDAAARLECSLIDAAYEAAEEEAAIRGLEDSRPIIERRLAHLRARAPAIQPWLARAPRGEGVAPPTTTHPAPPPDHTNPPDPPETAKL